jgi:protein bicaudal D
MASTEDEDPYIQIAKLHSANLQAAEYGLALIDEKKVLELKHIELENQHDLLKLEYEQLKIQLKTLQVNKREETLKGETNEETLLNEKQTREEYLMKEITRHEHELRLLKHDNERLHMENEKMSLNCQELTERIHELDELKVKLKYELKETKGQEQRLIDANTELEEDNVALQQQVQKLRENLIDFDGLKHENKQFQENVSEKFLFF